MLPTARMDIHEVARQLNSHLGPTLVAALAGTPDRKSPIRWAKSDGPTRGLSTPVGGHPSRRAWTHTAGAEGEHVARFWFIGQPSPAGDHPADRFPQRPRR